MQAFQIIGFTPILTENLTNGDCFFSAIYRSLHSRGLLPSVAGCLNLQHSSEAEFIQEARNLVATHVIAGEAMGMYEGFMVNFGADLNSLKLQANSAPSYLRTYIYTKIAEKTASAKPNNIGFYTYNEFATKLASHIRTSGTWVGETEVTIFKNLLKLCNVVVDIYSSTMPNSKLPKRVGDKFYIYLYNVGEIHWKHFILQDPGTQITLSRNTTPGILNSRWRGGKPTKHTKRSTRRRKASTRRTRKA